jgi:hypothetical protein
MDGAVEGTDPGTVLWSYGAKLAFWVTYQRRRKGEEYNNVTDSLLYDRPTVQYLSCILAFMVTISSSTRSCIT